MFRFRAAAATFAVCAAAWTSGAVAADQKVTLPILSPCAQAKPPDLPARWRAVGLLMPFVHQQLDVGEFTYDGSLPAMRATVYGVKSGAVDLLITAGETYQLVGPHDAPNACITLGPKYRAPAAHWLPDKAGCDGIGPLGPTRVQWWKTAAPDGRSNWQWYKDDTRLPFRMMFSARSPDPAVIGDYGMIYFPTFTPAAASNLAHLRDFCAGHARKAEGATAAAASARDLMTPGNDIPEAERGKILQTLIPGLSRQACTGLAAPNWPHHYVMTGILSPVPAKWTPLPSVIFYDWGNATNLSAWMYEARTQPPVLELVSILKKGVGYSIERNPAGGFACLANGPGTVRPDWMSVAGCECKAVIDNNPDLGPGEVTQIRACPIKDQPHRVNWSWYSTRGRPILFTEPSAIGTGLNIADYLQWLPGAKMPQDLFDLPQLCTGAAAEAGLPPVVHGPSAALTRYCSDCHTTQQ